MTKTSNRKVYLDLIRIIAVCLVIFTHTGDKGSKLYMYADYGTLKNWIYILADVFRCINVPLFFMVSGALLLGKEESYSKILFKRVLKYIIITIVFSYFYYVVYYHNPWYEISSFLKGLVNGSIIGLFWFLYAYIGYLLILPFLRNMVKNLESINYWIFIVLGVLFKGLLSALLAYTGMGVFGVPCALVTDVIFYPIMGYYFANILLEEKFDRRFMIGGTVLSILCWFAAAYMTIWDMSQGGEWTENYLFSFNVIPTLFVFCLMKSCGKYIERFKLLSKWICKLGDATFGVYLISIWLQIAMAYVFFFYAKYFPNMLLIASYLYVGTVWLTGSIIVLVVKWVLSLVNRKG